ncbi:hypothetical protein B0T10DRAFT_494431 [Thelonectria olida]|uniref:Uncharacterized protein n=1 Tax=Thelonectria olida TaxID=1576542 RepID=A0A9P8VZD6_9HYPO|nr:hypothetical protein B0T10DRAFT_494431 [Thelonectria olida]
MSASARAIMAARPISVAASRGIFTSTPVRLGLKETSTHDAFASERHKQDSLAKQKCGTGHWKPELASDSEEAVRADRAAAEGAAGVKVDEAIRILQEKTKSTAEETAKAGTSMRDGT